ncbi:MAG: nucleotidyltransferase domain-containing protein [Gammaproteobacteria bacterium]
MTEQIIYAHPVEPLVRERILQALADIEAEHQVEIIYACESGSRGWGFASPDSDYDVRFIYVPRLPWYLTVEPQRDVIELPISDELDVNGWELRKALRLLKKSNPTLLEWLDSPIVYREDAGIMRRLRELAARQFTPQRVRHHYLSMAKKNFRGYLQGEQVRLKKYLYVLRPLLAVRWVDQGRGAPPMRFADLVAGTVHDTALLQEINALLAAKMRVDEAEYGPRWPAIHAFIDDCLTESKPPPAMAKADGDSAALDLFLYETLLALAAFPHSHAPHRNAD